MTELFVRLQNTIAERQDERGAAMAEYGLLLALVALAAIVILGTFGDNIREVFTQANTELEGGLNNGGTTTTTGG